MQPNHVDGEVTTNLVSTKETLIAPLCKPTPLSKYFALALFVVLPFVGGMVGYTLAPSNAVEVYVSPSHKPIAATIKETETKANAGLQIVSCEPGTEDIEGLPIATIKKTFDTYKGGTSDFMNAEFVQIHTEYGIDAKVGFHCVLSDGSYLLTIFNGTVSGLSLVRMSDGVVTNEVLAGAQYKGSDAAIVPEFSTTTISFSGHVIDPCYDLSQNFVFNLSEFSLKFVNSTGGDVPDCQANI